MCASRDAPHWCTTADSGSSPGPHVEPTGRSDRAFPSSRRAADGAWARWLQTYRGIVVGSIRLVEVLTDAASRTAIEEAKKTLRLGSGLSSGPFADLMILAMDRGRQLIRSMGLAIDSPHEAMSPSNGQDATESIPHLPAVKPTVGKEQAVPPPREEPPPPIRTKPLETLQAFQDSLQAA